MSVHHELALALAAALSTDSVDDLRRLSGGASRETWAFEADDRPLILQRARPGGVRGDTGMATEAALLRAAAARGVPVPAVVAAAGDTGRDRPASSQPMPDRSDVATAGAGTANAGAARAALGPAWLVLERVDGETIPRRILRDAQYAPARSALAGQCGRALAAIHSIDPGNVGGLDTTDQFDQYRELLDALGEPHPAFELGFRWLGRNRPPARTDTVVHGDFRNGNLVVGPDGLRAVLDWELAHRGDPLEDLGWLCIRAWRFGVAPRVGGFGEVDDLVAAYEAASGAIVDRDALAWWEAMGTLKWGLMCMMQAATHLSGTVRSVELAAIGRRVCEVEHDLLLLLP
jgi:aminoglycoside phosphotransferase (APT) family kinase protein